MIPTLLLLVALGAADQTCPVQVISAHQHYSPDMVNIKFKNTGDKTIKAAAFYIDMIDATNDAHEYPGKLTVVHKTAPGKDASFWIPVDLPNFKAQAFNGVKAHPLKVVFADNSDMTCK